MMLQVFVCTFLFLHFTKGWRLSVRELNVFDKEYQWLIE